MTSGPVGRPPGDTDWITVLDRNGLEILGRDECLALVASSPVGRVALSADALPVVLPVNHRLLGDSVVFATGVGSKLLSMEKGTVVAFEADAFDPASRSGWSVLVVGVAHQITEGDREWGPANALDLHPWVGHHASYLVRLTTERISGRRLRPAPAPPPPRRR